ncbi:uncharacterized protein LOC143632319 [Bidens hawaiensis]|uniref:uncharacterized protein LOC143632319 n=1 Tax=Bidens hawaiensis TaxID=980011 RepID=UPI0040498830
MASAEMMNCSTTVYNSTSFNKTIVYHDLMCHLSFTNTSRENLTELISYEKTIYKSDLEDTYGEPMKTIGFYIAVASLCCTLAMVVDLLNRLRRKQLWFPCKYFSLNAFSLTVIVVAMKLPVDLSGNMPGPVDQAAKLGSMAFMCTMMANFLPSLATLGNTELLTNVTALGVLVITLVVNVCIQIHTGVVGILPNNKSIKTVIENGKPKVEDSEVFSDLLYTTVAIIYVAMLLLLLIIYVCSSLAILGSKLIIESKYQQQHETTSKSIKNDQLTFEKLQQHVSNYWIMAGSSSPQFIQACFATTAASRFQRQINMIQITRIQCQRFSRYSLWESYLFYKVEKYWNQKLYDWKDARISLPFRSHTLKVVITNLRNPAVKFCIILQLLFKVVFGSSVKRTEDSKQNDFVLQLENENELAERILKGFLKSFEQLIKKSEEKQPKNLIKLITERSTEDFRGVLKYVNDDHPDCWSLAVVTLTTIAATLPNVEKVEVDSLLESVREGLEYVTVVEENFDAPRDYVSIQKAAEKLWQEVDICHRWLGIRLEDIASQGNTTLQIVQLFFENAKSKIKEGEGRTHRSICVNSMYRITQTISGDKESHNFDELSSRIADIMAACLTNLPQVIAMKAHTSVIEEREASVKAAAQLLGETKEIIKILQGPSRHVPSMDREDLRFINKWHAHLREP